MTSNPCFNSGTCLPSMPGSGKRYSCKCPDHYGNERCETHPLNDFINATPSSKCQADSKGPKEPKCTKEPKGAKGSKGTKGPKATKVHKGKKRT